MAISKTAKEKQTNIRLRIAYNRTKQFVGKLSKTAFADILCKKKQNIGTRISYDGVLLFDEAETLLNYLTAEGYTYNDFYNKLFQTIHPIEQNTDFIEFEVRNKASVNSNSELFDNNESVTEICKIPTKTLKQFGTSLSNTEIIYVQGDSMSPEIESGDTLLVDKSQTEIIDGVIYAFEYNGQIMYKRLQKISNIIKAVSKNPLYEAFEIDFELRFKIIGRVVGIMRPIL